jgi:type I site-specific restriction endonuclease
MYNIIDCGTRTGKTYWAVNNLQEYTRDGALNRVLYLVDTNALKDAVLESYSDTCADADMFWDTPSFWGENTNKIGVMCY